MLLDKTRTVKIADFGVARIEASNPNDMTGETGTLGYMAPEVNSLPLFNLSRLSALNYAIFSWFTENIISGSSFDKYYMCIMKVMPDCAKAWFPFKNLFILFFFNFHFVLYWVMIKKKKILLLCNLSNSALQNVEHFLGSWQKWKIDWSQGSFSLCGWLQVLNGNPYNRKCDVYSFGICLWEIYCCDMPYSDLSFSEVTSAVVRQVWHILLSHSFLGISPKVYGINK